MNSPCRKVTLAPFANVLLERVKELLGQPCKRRSRLQIGTDHGGTIVFGITVSSSRQVANPKRLVRTVMRLSPSSMFFCVLKDFPRHVFFRSDLPPAFRIAPGPGEGTNVKNAAKGSLIPWATGAEGNPAGSQV